MLELTVGPRAVRVSNPDKVYFPALGITKSDVVRYFLSVGDGILAAVRERPTMLERSPGGGGSFFQRRVPTGAPDWVETTRVVYSDGSHADMVCPTETAVVAWAASLGTLTFHPAPVRRPDIGRPDQLRIDLDPQPGTAFRDAVRVAVELRGLLAEHGLVGFPKTSGGRGLHVCVPIEPRWSFAEVLDAQLALGRELARRLPEQVTIDRLKRDRGERVFADCGQMTIASAYSIRPTARARVSAPVTWDELADVTPDDFDVTTMPARFVAVGDLHAGLAEPGFSIESLIGIACDSR